jgi:septum formation protein
VTFILASGSASRQRILKAVGVPFTAIPADVDEGELKQELLVAGMYEGDIADTLAQAKAQHVSYANPTALVLGADQILLFEDEIVSKCTDLAGAGELLRRLRGKSHKLVSALVLARGGAPIWRHAVNSTLTMRDFSDAFLDAYLSTEGEGILGCVGCYKVEGLGAQLFDRVEGDYFAIQGLPLLPLLVELRRQGVIAT